MKSQKAHDKESAKQQIANKKFVANEIFVAIGYSIITWLLTQSLLKRPKRLVQLKICFFY
jgi:hypothetical protein